MAEVLLENRSIHQWKLQVICTFNYLGLPILAGSLKRRLMPITAGPLYHPPPPPPPERPPKPPNSLPTVGEFFNSVPKNLYVEGL